MKHLFLLVLISLISTSVKAQLPSKYNFPDKVPEGYVTPYEESLKYITSLMHKGFTDEEWKRICKGIESYQQDILYSGEIYINWEQADDYLNKVFKQVLPDNLKEDKHLHLYVARDGSFNATTHMDGSIYLNIGVLADADNEAALAEVLGHELTHYINQDSRKRLEANASKILRHKDMSSGSDTKPELENAHNNQQQEKACDSVGAIYATKAGYSLSGILSAFYYMRLLEKTSGEGKSFGTVYTDGKNHNTSMYKLLADHPEAVERINALSRMKLQRNGKNYLIDSAKFNELQHYARIEQLTILLENAKYKRCIEKAFTFHLLEPDNNYYVYILVEALRRQLYLYPNYKKYKFIAQEYPSIYKKNQTVFNNLAYIIKDSAKATHIKAKELLDSLHPKFTNYSDAFKYFAVIAEKRDIKEVYLSEALFYCDNTTTSNSYLSRYLADKDAPMADFANAYKANKNDLDVSETSNRDLVILPRIRYYEYLEGGWRESEVNGEGDKMEEALRSYISNKFKSKDVVTLEGLVKTNFDKNVYYRRLINLATILKENTSNNDNKNFFVLDPDLWYGLEKNKLKSVVIIAAESFAIKAKHSVPFCLGICGGSVNTGNMKYFYKVQKVALDKSLKSGEVNTYSNTVYYKMTAPHLLNTIYYAIKSH